MITRRYDFMCKRMTCYYHYDGRKHTCTDCAAAKQAAVREHCQWDHGVLMLALSLKRRVHEADSKSDNDMGLQPRL